MSELPNTGDVYTALDRGEVAAAKRWIETHGASDAWSLVFDAALTLMGELSPLSVDPQERFDPTSPAAQYLCLERARLSVLQMSTVHVTYWRDVFEALPAPDPVRLGIVRAWSTWSEGQVMDDAIMAGIERDAAQAGEARLAVEMASLRALHTLLAEDLPKSLAQARRASRMARAESIPQAEYIAHLVLARVRRHHGDPHLSARILSGLGRVVPPVWQPWLRLERRLAGVAGEEETDQALAQLALAATEGRPNFEAASVELRTSVGDIAPLRAEIDLLIAASAGSGDHPSLMPWQTGQSLLAPPSLRGLLAHGRPESPVVHVLASRDQPAKRTLSPGVELFRVETAAGGESLFVPAEVARRGARGIACLSALLLAGAKGAEDAPLFESVYGFAYEQEVHRGVFDVLKSRLRAQVSAFGELEKVNGRNRIALRGPVAVPDPRCLPSVRSQVLQALASEVMSAKEVASSLGIALRTAQQALKALVADGDCEVRKEGRRVNYILEDTTYSEPTRH